MNSMKNSFSLRKMTLIDGMKSPIGSESSEQVLFRSDEISLKIQAEKKGWLAKVSEARNRYISSFTVHSVEHIVKGTLPEKIFWSIKLVGAISLAIYLSRSLFVAFMKHEVDTKLSIEKKMLMKLPTVLICVHTPWSMSYNNCSSNASRSWNPDVCETLNRAYPDFLANIMQNSSCTVRQELSYKLHSHGDISCHSDLMGQCVALNHNSKAVQTINYNSLEYKQEMDPDMFPLHIYVKAPGNIDLFHQDQAEIVDRFGHYHFTLKKMTVQRHPFPYSNPPCVEQNSVEALERNIFRGNYTIDKCVASCWARAELKFCQTMMNINRVLVREQDVIHDNIVDRTSEEVDECMTNKTNDISEEYNGCIKICHHACYEETLDVNVRHRLSSSKNTINLEFHFKDMEQTNVIEVPSTSFSTLLANFGGTLGLMTGMSAISFLEVIVWGSLYLVESAYPLCRRIYQYFLRK